MPLETPTLMPSKVEPRQPRARGEVRLSVRHARGRTVLDRLHQAGSAKLLLPRDQAPDRTAVLLNTAGGVTGGDRFRVEVAVAQDAALTLTSQTAERAYRAQPDQTGEIRTQLNAGAGATIHWLPQETILFNHGALARRLDVDLAEDANLLAVEPVILGRAAMGETVHNARFSDQWRVRRQGRLIYADNLRLHGNVAAMTEGSATLGGHRAFASILFATIDAERHLAPLRTMLPETAGASLIRPGVLAARLTASDGLTLRRTLIPVLEMLRGYPMPTVWKM
ncbi:MAG: urease accessory protein UreD [Paracoccaceae bacterium]